MRKALNKMKKTILFVLLFVVMGCSQTINLGFRWDKNTESDMSHYDLFTYILPDSALFYQLDNWPTDTTDIVKIDSSYHYQYLLASMAHIYSPIDSMIYEWDQEMSQAYLRGYIVAADSAGNISYITPSLNIIDIGDRIAPKRVRENTYIYKRD
jgi:hypothetical protein